jgi:alkylated DNA repair protein alkB homolog 1
MEDEAVDQDLDVLDFARGLAEAQTKKLVAIDTVSSELIDSARKAFKSDGERIVVADEEESASLPEHRTIYEHKDFPGTTLHRSIM